MSGWDIDSMQRRTSLVGLGNRVTGIPMHWTLGVEMHLGSGCAGTDVGGTSGRIFGIHTIQYMHSRSFKYHPRNCTGHSLSLSSRLRHDLAALWD